ncbi:MAG: hypothetical protein K9M94_13480 [Spirochaetia bacterium]|nr:hypothetical protein [Spirochaetia bacterium]
MKRSIIFITVLMVSLAAAAMPLMAEGMQEQAEPVQPGTRPYGWSNNPAVNPQQLEQLEISGTVEFTAGHTRLHSSDGEVYELMYPMFLAEDLEVENGQTISVEGFLIPGTRWSSDEDEQYLRLEKVTVRGQEYDLGTGGYAWGQRHHGPGMMGGSAYGRGPGMMGGYGYDRGPGMMGGGRAPRGGYQQPGMQPGYGSSNGYGWRRSN